VKQALRSQWRYVAVVLGLTLVAALIPADGWMKAVAVLPLALLVLPGYALATALFPTAVIGRDERLALVFAFNVAACALGAVLLQIVVPLDRTTWALLLSALTLGAGYMTWVRRGERQRRGHRTTTRLPWVSPIAVAAIVAALAGAGWAVALATQGAHRQLDQSHFSSLWAVARGDGGTAPASIGVSNQEGRDVSYLVRVSRAGAAPRDWQIHLTANQQWQKDLAASSMPGSGPLIVELYQAGVLLRHVKLGASS
jgi:uncharacterized membrane protein